MGACMSAATPESKLIDSKMLAEEQKDKVTHKLLLVGTGNAGKTTFFRQFQLLAGYQFTAADRKTQAQHIGDQVVRYMLIVSRHYKDRVTNRTEGQPLSPTGLLKKIDEFLTLQNNYISMCELTVATGKKIKELWSYEEIKWEYAHIERIPIPDSCAYFWDNVDRVSSEKYIPTDNDLMLSRVPTSGASTFEFTRNDMSFVLVDIGGQRCERKKWMNYFDNVTGLLYVVSLSAFDEVLYEDKNSNAMEDAIREFETTIHLPVFEETSVILFLNKFDLFESKLRNGKSIKNFAGFSDYDGPCDDVSASAQHIQKFFHSKNGNKSRSIFVHTTHATDTASVHRILINVTQTLVQSCMKMTGLL